MRFDRIATDADDSRMFSIELLDHVAKLRALAGSTRCIVFGIEPEHEIATEQVVCGNNVAFIVEKGQHRQFVAYF